MDFNAKFQAASPACTELETIVLDWLGRFFNVKFSTDEFNSTLKIFQNRPND